MIERTEKNSQTEEFLKKNFNDYKKTTDPYEKLIIYKTDKIIGLISYSIIYERAEINYIAVDSNYQQQGIATKLLKRALQDITNNNCSSTSLEVETNNIPAIKLYQKFNFEIKAIRQKYYKDKDAYLMIRR